MAIRETDKGRVVAYLTPDEKDVAARLAALDSRSLSAWAAKVLREKLARSGPKKKARKS